MSTESTGTREQQPNVAQPSADTLDPTADDVESDSPHHAPSGGRDLVILALTALGVVYGDIGTSPLYALRECFSGFLGIAPSPANIFGVLSLIFWP